MTKYTIALLLSLVLTGMTRCQTIVMPADLSIDKGRLGSILITHDGEDIKWVTPSELDSFREYDPDPKKIRLRLIGSKEGTFQLFAICVKGNKLSEFSICKIQVGKAPPIPPTPDPDPPGPNPPGPDPDNPAPIPLAGFRVLITYESGKLSEMPAKQMNILYDQQLRQYLDSKCVVGKDGKTKEWRIWDADVDKSGAEKHWQDAATRKKDKLPWILISDGKRGYEGPLPEDTAKTIELLKKYGG
jgi:hypothetical protein